jgi:glycerophosphoryl diester phosphodiesterase
MSSTPLIIGHRGASRYAPENSLAAFRRALDDGADGIEFDVRLARDGVPVIIHDDTLRRTALREGSIAALSSEQLREIDVGTWFNLRHPALARPEYTCERLPTLAAAFEMLKERNALLYVEMKCTAQESDDLARAVASLIDEYSFTDRVVVESFHLASIAAIKRLDTRFRTAALFEPKLSRPLPSMLNIMAKAEACGADELALHRTLATRRIVEEAHRRGMNTVVWTADRPAWIRRARLYGIHAIITNDPAGMLAQRKAVTGDG